MKVGRYRVRQGGWEGVGEGGMDGIGEEKGAEKEVEEIGWMVTTLKCFFIES